MVADLAWIDDCSDESLLSMLTTHGADVNLLNHEGPSSSSEAHGSPFQIVPLRDGWFRIGLDDAGRLMGRWIVDPADPDEVVGAPVLFDEVDAEDLHGWFRARADIDGSGRRWVSVMRRPEREAYVAIVLEAGAAGPVRQRIIAGVYPDITLCDDGRWVAFVEPDREVRGATRAVLELVGDGFADTRTIVREAPSGGIGVRPCSVRRFIKLSHGVRTTRLWDLVDVRSTRPKPLVVPGTPTDPNLFDVAMLNDSPVLIQANNLGGYWEFVVSVIDDEEILTSWRTATGYGSAMEVSSGVDCALVRVRDDSGEHVLNVPLSGFSSEQVPLADSPGMFTLQMNATTPAVGFGATELTGGQDPFDWYWTPQGRVLNPSADIEARAACQVRRAVEQLTSDDGYEFRLDVRWRQENGEKFVGPVLLMVYGAYGIDIDLDTDRDLGRWLDRGFAVATPHVRGGGGGARHLAGCRANRDRSLADVRATASHLRGPSGVVQATKLVVIGASAGGFLAATTLNTCPDDVDACVIVNGYVDPLTSLVRRDTATTAGDQDEWGDPDVAKDRELLESISPVDNLTTAGKSKVLVVVSARDARVNPRQGLKWFLRFRDLGGEATLWFDPMGAHDCWGADMPPDALIDWVCRAIDQPES